MLETVLAPGEALVRCEDDERILELSERLNAVAGEKIGEIASVNRASKMLVVSSSETG